MTWDNRYFPSPIRMQEDVASRGRKMVTIVDPHVKRDSNYPIFSEAQQLGYYVKNKDGGEFDGWCWPGECCSGPLDKVLVSDYQHVAQGVACK